MEYKKKLEKNEAFRINSEDQDTINLASKISGYKKSDIIRIGALKEAKRILKDIEKGEKWTEI